MRQRRDRKLVWPREQANKLAKKFAWGDWGQQETIYASLPQLSDQYMRFGGERRGEGF